MKTKSWIFSFASAALITGLALFTPNQTEANVKSSTLLFDEIWIRPANADPYCFPFPGDCDRKVLPPIIIIPD